MMNHVPNRSYTRLDVVSFGLPLLAAAIAIIFVRSGFGFQYPVPWPDETGFVAQAFDYSRTASFFDPGLNPDRIVMWMPPGYMLLLAAVFRIFGYSYAAARWVSTFACLAALGIAASMAWFLASGWRRLVLGCCIFTAFLAPCLLVDANIARMEMPFAAIILLAVASACCERFILASALVLLGGLVHFNAIYFVPPLCIAVAVAGWRGRLSKPRLSDWLAIITSVVACLAYAIYVVAQWGGFHDDMAFQFALKQYVSINDAAHPLWPTLAGVLLALTAAFSRRLDNASIIGLFGLSFLVMAHNGHELWYDYGQPLGFCCITIALLADYTYASQPSFRNAAAVCAVCFIVITSVRITDALRPLLPHRAMLSRDVVSDAEIAKVRSFIATLPAGTTVDFGWSGMELFFLNDLARAGVRWTIIRHSVTQVWPLRHADWRVSCDSSELPHFLFKFDIDHPRKGADSGCEIIRQ